MKRIIITLVILLSFTASVTAELIDNGDGTITQIRNDGSVLMWLQDANYAQTSGYHETGDMGWQEAMTWIDYLNTNNYLGYTDWRLPAILPVNGISYNNTPSDDGSTDNGYNITSPNSELSYMYYVELGNKGQLDSTGPFINLKPAPAAQTP